MESDDDHKPKRMTEDERRELTRKRLGIETVDRDELRRARNGANGTANWVGRKAPPKT